MFSEYLSNLKIRNCNNKKLTVNNLCEFMNKKEAQAIYYSFYNELKKRKDSGYAESNNEIYKIVNQSLGISLVFNGSHNYERLSYIGNWIDNNHKYFGKTIADLGCLNGILTCYLAKEFPDSKVIGVDNNELSINKAKELARQLGLTNVEFVVADILDFDGKYDTIFSSFVMHEVIKYDELIAYKSKETKISTIKNQVNPWANKINTLLNPNGYYIGFERVVSGYGTYGLLDSFISNGLKLMETSSIKLDDGKMMGIICSNNDGSSYTDKYWRDILVPFEEEKRPDVYYDEALSRFDLYADELIEGYEVVDDEGNAVWRLVLATSNKDKTVLYELSVRYDQIVCYCYDVSYKDALIEDIRKAIKQCNGEVRKLTTL